MRYLPPMAERNTDIPATRRQAMVLAMAGLAAGFARPLHAQVLPTPPVASPWAQAHKAGMRLLAGERLPDGTRRAAIEIRLDDGFKTYWRHPGDAGLPPVFDWSGSTNVADVDVLWPAPVRFKDPAGFSNGYLDGVILPVTVTPGDINRPVKIALKLDFGVCKDICIPAHAVASLPLPEQGSGQFSRVIAAALARVPERVAFGAGMPGFVAVAGLPGEGRRGALSVTLRAPAASPSALFVEAPEPWLFGTPVATQTAGEEHVYRVPVEYGPEPGAAAASGPLALRLTLVLPDRAIESVATLDAGSFRA